MIRFVLGKQLIIPLLINRLRLQIRSEDIFLEHNKNHHTD